MSVSEIRGRLSSSQAAPGFHGALHRPATSGRTRWSHPGHERKGGGTPADAYLQPPHPQPSSFRLRGRTEEGRGARPAGRARLSAFHRGSCLGDPTPPLSSGYALPGTQASTGVARLEPVPVQRAPRRPVIVPAGRIPGAARERSANPPAGTAPAPSSGLPPERRPELSEISPQ